MVPSRDDELLRIAVRDDRAQLAAVRIRNPQHDAGRIEQRRGALEEGRERPGVDDPGEIGTERRDARRRSTAAPRARATAGGGGGATELRLGRSCGRGWPGPLARARRGSCARGRLPLRARLSRPTSSLQPPRRHPLREDDRAPSTRGAGRVATSGTASGRAPTGNSSSITTSPTAAAAPAAVSCRRSSAVALDSYGSRSARRASSIAETAAVVSSKPFGENQIGREQLLAAARVVARAAIHLLEILERAGGVVDRGLRPMRAVDWARNAVQRLANGRDAAVHLRGPELIALPGGDVPLLRGRAVPARPAPSRQPTRRMRRARARPAVRVTTPSTRSTPRRLLPRRTNPAASGATPGSSCHLHNRDVGRYYSKVPRTEAFKASCRSSRSSTRSPAPARTRRPARAASRSCGARSSGEGVARRSM